MIGKLGMDFTYTNGNGYQKGCAMSLKSLFSRRKPIPPEAIDALLAHLATPDTAFTEKFQAHDGSDNDAFLTKDCIYQQALTMACILSREKEDNRFTAIRKRFEDAALPIMRRNITDFDQRYFSAMREIAALESSENKDLRWAREWFADIGVDLTNPAELALFAVMWKQRVFHLLKLLIEVGESY